MADKIIRTCETAVKNNYYQRRNIINYNEAHGRRHFIFGFFHEIYSTKSPFMYEKRNIQSPANESYDYVMSLEPK